MHALDWVVVGLYMAGVVGVGLYFARRASASADDYVVAGRKLPWWVIGFSDVASSAGADAFWVYAVFVGSFMALYHFWWIGAVLSLPLAVLWARYWRRLKLSSPGEIYEVRYSGRAAGAFRGFFAVWTAFVSSAVVLAYVLRGVAQILQPFFGWPVEAVLALFVGTSVLYSVMSGLLGVAYSDVPQFILMMVARVALMLVLLDFAGGLDHVLDLVVDRRGAAFLKPHPPSSAPVYGDFSVDPGSLVALALFGLFSVAGTQSVAVQRSLAARSELDAALGQMLNAVLTLVVRLAPLVVIGLVAVALFPTGADGTNVWAQMVRAHAGPGFLGLILVGVVAGYMSTIDTYLNFIVALLLNDLYRRHVRPEASQRELVWFGRIATVAVAGVAFLWAFVLIGRIDSTWLKFINTVIGLFMLPLTLLRWTWWRLNIWGEVVGFVAAFPLAYVVWFVLDFKSAPYWQAFSILFLTGWSAILLVTFLTPSESPHVLRNFYQRVRPPGFWGPFHAGHDADRQERRLDLLSALTGIPFCIASVVGLCAGLARETSLMWSCVAVAAVSCGWFASASIRAERLRRD